jgi:hypothetical protein
VWRAKDNLLNHSLFHSMILDMTFYSCFGFISLSTVLKLKYHGPSTYVKQMGCIHVRGHVAVESSETGAVRPRADRPSPNFPPRPYVHTILHRAVQQGVLLLEHNSTYYICSWPFTRFFPSNGSVTWWLTRRPARLTFQLKILVRTLK